MTEAMKKAVKDVLYSRPMEDITDKQLIELTGNKRIRTNRLAKRPGVANGYDVAVFQFKLKGIAEIVKNNKTKDEKAIMAILNHTPTIEEIMEHSQLAKQHVELMKASYEKGGSSYGYIYHSSVLIMDKIGDLVDA